MRAASMSNRLPFPSSPKDMTLSEYGGSSLGGALMRR
jgi:hypothetical protein